MFRHNFFGIYLGGDLSLSLPPISLTQSDCVAAFVGHIFLVPLLGSGYVLGSVLIFLWLFYFIFRNQDLPWYFIFSFISSLFTTLRWRLSRECCGLYWRGVSIDLAGLPPDFWFFALNYVWLHSWKVYNLSHFWMVVISVTHHSLFLSRESDRSRSCSFPPFSEKGRDKA